MTPLRNLWSLALVVGLFACSTGETGEIREITDPAPATRALAEPTHEASGRPVIVELPVTRAGAVARALLDAINGGDEAQLRALFEERLSAAARAAAPLELWLAFCRDLGVNGGGLDVVRVDPLASGADVVRFHVRARRADRYVVMVLRVDDLDQIAEIEVHPAADPATEADVLPDVAMAEDDAVRAIERRLRILAAADRFSGAVLVAKGDRVLVRAAYGLADHAFAVANRVDTKFNLGSMNKMFTAVAVGQLVEAGKLSFTDTLAEVLPDYPNQAFARAATIHHLLTHTSGIGGTAFPPELFEQRDRYRRPADYLPLFADEAPLFPPGARFEYANHGYLVLGLVIERLSGQDYDDYVREHVFEPAGMRDTAARAWDEVTPNLAVGYMRGPADPLGLQPRRTNVSMLPFRGSPAGGGYSTVDDLLAFAHALRDHRLVGAAMLETLTAPKVETPWKDPARRYGYGFLSHHRNGREIRGHGGGAPGINGELQIFQDGSYTVAVLGNYDHPNALAVADEISAFLARQAP